MAGVRFVRVELDYGCYAGRVFRFNATGAPTVILGPNGSGKSTLLEALVRALFGFNRRHQADRARLEHRHPWGRDACRAALVVADADGALWRLDRNFHDMRVRIQRMDPPGDEWEGEANPAADNEDAREYRRRLQRIIGFADIDAYVSTACILQGELRTTRPSDDLLRLATGGHRDVQRARERLKEAHRELTARRIGPDDTAARKGRRLEELEQQVQRVAEQLARAEAAERQRGPLVAERTAALERMAALEAEIELLEAAQRPLAEITALQAELEAVDSQLSMLERAEQRLRAAHEEYKAADAAWREWAAGPLYPDDFLERLSRLDSLWRSRTVVSAVCEEREAALAGMRRPTLATAAAAASFTIVAGGAALVAAGVTIVGLVVLLVGIGGGIGALLARQRLVQRRDAVTREAALLRERLRDTEDEIAQTLAGIPDADTLTPDTAPDRRDRFERQRAARSRSESAAERLRAAIGEARTLADDDAADVERAGGSLDDVARHVLERVSARAAAARRERAEIVVKLEQAEAAAVRLPDGVPAELAAVQRALEERRAELREVRARLNELERKLLEATTGTESAVALRDRLRALEAERDEVEAAVRAYAAAYALLGDAYAEFRGRDQQRLVRLISDRLLDITRARLGPLEVSDSLADAQLRAFDRVLPISSPPLSFGEHHAAALAIRIGAADFLSMNGIEPPLLVDEPFAYLDPDRAAHTWELLTRIARHRQVIVATQDRLVLEHLGVQPDVVLGG